MGDKEALMDALKQYNACDISDALLKLKVPYAGFLVDILPRTSTPGINISVATTVLFAPKDTTEPKCSLPADTHFADFITPSCTVVVSQPPDQRCAVVGGIVAERMYQLGARAIIVDGRVRDLEELGKRDDLMVFSKGVSTVGAGAEARVVAVDDVITVQGVDVASGDIVFADSKNGVVIIPAAHLVQVVGMLPKMVAADAKAMEDVRSGKKIYDAFKKHRGG
ncbi:uncharacterized protein LAJ45_06444 [Morchella importuna]|uniref:DlpA domain-containing protein n=1 Tax=Morchella conica CCBAS932 TaxID=1392247 RepID=A0A3N4L3G0_9PEZI|nr:uncharacterized protein LAJ45_06444 [Morchella importuna]KAH8149365.1 hypothetical protein LAJ45_06444 [Morchella importuna]RPB17430.1 DlpA domain-containing protein [Morchella conica CCBAS932]